MASGATSRCETLDLLFKDLSQNIDVVSKQIKGGQVTREPSEDSFLSEPYWSAVDGIFNKLSTEATKLSLAFSKSPFPSVKNTDAMVTEIEKGMLSLASIFYTLPLSQGKALRKAFQKTVVNVLENLHCFSMALLECVTSTGDSQRLVWTGSVWQATDLPILKDNKTCVLKELATSGELVQDALGEIEEAKESDGLMDVMLLEDGGEDELDDGPTWTDQDKHVIEACTGLVKATKTVLKKCRESVHKTEIGASSSPETVPILDDLVELTDQVSPRVDQFVCGIYAPIQYMEMRDTGKHLADLIEQILQLLRSSSLTNNMDEKWLDFLHKAVTHNLEKLTKSTESHQGDG